ncbi:hypothetical protein [Thermogemmatispora sp.]|uniref:hypothetical protein n=1 Tax=Thermogemmatispora sp. TaxID=1968838 RepID=UPI0035E425F8
MANSFCAFCGSTLAETFADLTEMLPQGEEAGYVNARFPLAADLPNPLDERQYRSLTPPLASLESAASAYSSGWSASDPYSQGSSVIASGPYPLVEAQPTPASLEGQQRQRRGWGDGLIGALFYLWGAACALFGLTGLFLAAPEAVLGGLVLGIGTCELLALPLVLIFRRYPRLRLGKRLLAEGLALLGGFLLVLIGSLALSAPKPLGDIAMGTALLLYGAATMFLALW